jgi:hypothetical protein
LQAAPHLLLAVRDVVAVVEQADVDTDSRTADVVGHSVLGDDGVIALVALDEIVATVVACGGVQEIGVEASEVAVDA